MERHKLAVVISLMILLASFYFVSLQSPVFVYSSKAISSSSSSTAPPAGALVVPDDYPTIQAAVGNASAGDNVFVRNGIYKERITIDKPLSLIGEDRQKTVIGGAPILRFGTSFVIKVTAENVLISGFTIKNDSAGIWVDLENYQLPPPSQCKIIGNNVEHNGVGISIQSGEKQVISGNNITANSASGISIGVASSNSVISENYITGNGEAGIDVFSKNITINQNSIIGNGLDVNGVPEFRGGLAVGRNGPFYVYGNNITDNQGYGIQFAGGSNNSPIYQNNIERNSVGIELFNFPITGDLTIGTGNKVYRNNLINNSKQVFVEKAWRYAENFPNYTWTNGTDIVSWDNGKEGNYWNDYLSKYPNAIEVDNSGIGNTPYAIDENNADYYPLMQPVNISTESPLPSTAFSDSILTIIVIVIIVAFVAILFVYRARRKRKQASTLT